ncbi:MAG TPA: DUF1080 domain-containing protein [Opitutaceae bacterium]|nr:DUF1080 domain-containing protein [Opitutaceae bacterium]
MRLLPLLALPLCLVASVRAESAATIDLFAAKDFAGMQYVVSPATDIKAVCTRKADGSIAVTGAPIGYLATTASYENYQLHVEWRWPVDAAKTSNGGVLLHIASGPVNGTQWPICFQMQTKPTRAGDILPMGGDAKFAEKLSTPPGAPIPQLARQPADSAEKPFGEWNSCDITCRNGTIEVTINGVFQNKVTQCSPAKGLVGLQLEGTPYELRNMRLTPLK